MDNNTEITTQEGFTNVLDLAHLSELGDDYAGLSFKLDRISFPKGGATVFEIPAEDGEGSDIVKELKCVILYNHAVNTFYSGSYAGGHERPDCCAFDGVHGIGNPGGECANCPYNQFAPSDDPKQGLRKACKNKRSLYLLREGEFFPVMMTLPTGSISTFTQYLKSQLSRGRRVSDIVTRITVKRVVKDGPEFSQAQFSMARPLTPEEQAALKPLCGQMKEYAQNMARQTVTMNTEECAVLVDQETGEVIQPMA